MISQEYAPSHKHVVWLLYNLLPDEFVPKNGIVHKGVPDDARRAAAGGRGAG